MEQKQKLLAAGIGADADGEGDTLSVETMAKEPSLTKSSVSKRRKTSSINEEESEGKEEDAGECEKGDGKKVKEEEKVKLTTPSKTQAGENAGISLLRPGVKRAHQPDVDRSDIITRTLADRMRPPDEEVYFDLEATGLQDTNPHITQIGAINSTGDTFNTFVIPKRPIGQQASQVTGITCVAGQVFYHGKRMDAIPIKEALVKFRAFLGDTAILVGHNAHLFDCPVLGNAAEACGMLSQFDSLRCLDTWTLFKACKPGLRSYAQVKLVARFVGVSYNAHSALEDAKALQKLVSAAGISPYAKKAHMITLGSAKYW